MKRTFEDSAFTYFFERLPAEEKPLEIANVREPVHVVYGGADRFQAGTVEKFGRLALASLDRYACNFADFARAMWLQGAENLPSESKKIDELIREFDDNEKALSSRDRQTWMAIAVYKRTIEKLKNEPVEDLRIDFEDGYGLRSNDEEDRHAEQAASEYSVAIQSSSLPPFSGIRIKSLAGETRQRAFRTLDIFLSNLLNSSKHIPSNFVVTLPKVRSTAEVETLVNFLREFEAQNQLPERSVNIELVFETPEAFIDENGSVAPAKFVNAADGRCTSAHFGAYDFTSSLAIAGNHQHLRHDACDFARRLMQVSLAPLGIRLSDSVTTEMPLPIHRGDDLSVQQIEENTNTVHRAWRKHFKNVTLSLVDGFYQSWDLHPAQLPARYAAIYAFYLEAFDAQATRLRAFIDKASQATLTGNQFDDAASAQGLLNFFIRGIQCRAFEAETAALACGTTTDALMSGSFAKILELRTSGKII